MFLPEPSFLRYVSANCATSVEYCKINSMMYSLHGRRCNRNWQTNALLLKACLRGLMHAGYVLDTFRVRSWKIPLSE